MSLENELFIEDTEKLLDTLAILKQCKSVKALETLKESIDIRIGELDD